MKKKLIETLIALRDEDFSGTKRDEEDRHIDVDQALLDYINDPVVQELYNSIEMWFA